MPKKWQKVFKCWWGNGSAEKFALRAVAAMLGELML
jgi:hypothetical protein